MRYRFFTSLLLLGTTPVVAAETTVAVAASFAGPAEAIADAFHGATGDTLVLSFGSTGSLYAQITHGAPYTILLAADDMRPAQAIAEGFAVEGTAFTYAVGKAVLYSPLIDVTDGQAVLRSGDFSHLAIAEPDAAPYGAAAMEILGALGLGDFLSDRIVTGENVSQTLQFIESGNAELGFVALSQVIDMSADQVWMVPTELYTPVRQDAVVLTSGRNDEVAIRFIEFLKGDTARAIVRAYGYDVAAEVLPR